MTQNYLKALIDTVDNHMIFSDYSIYNRDSSNISYNPKFTDTIIKTFNNNGAYVDLNYTFTRDGSKCRKETVTCKFELKKVKPSVNNYVKYNAASIDSLIYCILDSCSRRQYINKKPLVYSYRRKEANNKYTYIFGTIIYDGTNMMLSLLRLDEFDQLNTFDECYIKDHMNYPSSVKHWISNDYSRDNRLRYIHKYKWYDIKASLLINIIETNFNGDLSNIDLSCDTCLMLRPTALGLEHTGPTRQYLDSCKYTFENGLKELLDHVGTGEIITYEDVAKDIIPRYSPNYVNCDIPSNTIYEQILPKCSINLDNELHHTYDPLQLWCYERYETTIEKLDKPLRDKLLTLERIVMLGIIKAVYAHSFRSFDNHYVYITYYHDNYDPNSVVVNVRNINDMRTSLMSLHDEIMEMRYKALLSSIQSENTPKEKC